MKNNGKKAIQTMGNEAYIGKMYDDMSFVPLIRLYNNEENIFQIEFLNGADMAYSFLPECTELLDILKDGIVGVSIKTISRMLLENHYINANKFKNTEKTDDDIVYFELNNWMQGEDYPNAEPFITWCGNDLRLQFLDEKWVKENELCVKKENIDMSVNFCITAKKSWVEKMCPSLLTEYKEFIRTPDKYGDVCGRFGTTFLEYKKDNIGICFVEDDNEYEEEDE